MKDSILNEFYNILKFFYQELPLILAGLFGSIIFLIKENKKRTLTVVDKLYRIVSGLFTSYYITPIIIDSLGLSLKLQSPVGFVVGYVGIEVIDFIVSFGKSKFKK